MRSFSKISMVAFSSVVGLGLLAAPALLAQDASSTAPQQQGRHWAGHRGMSPDQELAHMTKALKLTSDQQSQLKPILENRMTQLKQIRQDSSASREDRQQKMQSLDEDSNSKVEAVLNDQQKTKYEKMVEKRKQRMEQMREMRQHRNQQAPQSTGTEPQ